jgi:adenylosuccinate synthase
MKTSVNEAKDDAFLSKYEEVIFENAQGLLLSYREGDMHTTPSFTGMENINEIAKSISNVEESEICYVTRSYLTRHGAGPFPTECDVRKLNPDIIDNTNVHNPWQESIRYGMLDINELNERITADFAKCKLQNAKKSVMMTHLNEFDMETDEIDGLNYTSYDRFFENVHATKR